MAKLPVLIGAVQMPLNGLVFVCEGLMQGHQAFLRLAGGMFVSTGLMIGALKLWGTSLEGVWFCFFVFNISRLAFGLRHHLVDGPLAPSKLRLDRAAAGIVAANAGEDGGVAASAPSAAVGAKTNLTRPFMSHFGPRTVSPPSFTSSDLYPSLIYVFSFALLCFLFAGRLHPWRSPRTHRQDLPLSEERNCVTTSNSEPSIER